MSDLVEIHKEQQDQRSEDILHKHIIAAMCEDSRLFFVFDRLLDTDLQPGPADFSISVGGTKYAVLACSIKDDIREDKPWSLISIFLDQALSPGSKVTLKYHPEQWFISTADTGEPIESFKTVVTLGDTTALPGIRLDVEPQAIDASINANRIVDVGAKIEYAYDRSVKITFNQELDLTYQPTADNFRAESEDRWLDIASVYLARGARSSSGGKAWPELWIMLRNSILERSEVEIAFKPSKSGLITLDGAKAGAFRVKTQGAQDEPAEDEVEEVHISTMEKHGSWIAPVSNVEAPAQAEPLEAGVAAGSEIPLKNSKPTEAISAVEPDQRQVDNNTEKNQKAADFKNFKEIQPEIASAARNMKGLSLSPVPASLQTPLPGQVLRTYLGNGKKVAVPSASANANDKSEAEVAVENLSPLEIDLPDYDDEDLENKSSLPLKIAIGFGYFFVFSLVAVLLTLMVRVVGSKSSDEAPDLLSLSFLNSGPDREVCEMDYHDGSHYSGQCVGKKRDGRGSYQWKSGDSYEGTWSDDKMDGKGVLEYRNGDTYKGSFKGNLKHGTGAMNWANGARYQGGYKQGKLHGQGIYWSADGNRFEGEFQNGATTLNGTCYLTNGSSIQGSCQ